MDIKDIDSTLININDIVYVNKVLYIPGVIPIENNFKDIVLKGLENKNLDLINHFLLDKKLNEIGVNDIIISEFLSKKLNYNTNDKIKLLFFKNQKSTIPVVRKLNIVGIYKSNISEFDSRVVFSNINQSLSIAKWAKGSAGALEIFLNNDEKNSVDFIFDAIPPNYDIQKSSERFPEIFNWINLFDTNIYLIIILMVVVGGINMITALLVTVLDKTKLIGTLKVLGTTNSSITKIFMINGFFLVLRGVIVGNIISIGLILIQKEFMIFDLDPEIYYSEFVPIEFAPIKIILFNILLIFVCMLMLLIPSRVISKIKPNSVLKLS